MALRISGGGGGGAGEGGRARRRAPLRAQSGTGVCTDAMYKEGGTGSASPGAVPSLNWMVRRPDPHCKVTINLELRPRGLQCRPPAAHSLAARRAALGQMRLEGALTERAARTKVSAGSTLTRPEHSLSRAQAAQASGCEGERGGILALQHRARRTKPRARAGARRARVGTRRARAGARRTRAHARRAPAGKARARRRAGARAAHAMGKGEGVLVAGGDRAQKELEGSKGVGKEVWGPTAPCDARRPTAGEAPS